MRLSSEVVGIIELEPEASAEGLVREWCAPQGVHRRATAAAESPRVVEANLSGLEHELREQWLVLLDRLRSGEAL